MDEPGHYHGTQLNIHMTRHRHRAGFSLVELLVSLAILTMVIGVLTAFEKDVISLDDTLQFSLNAQLGGREVVRTMVTELRKATQSAVGSYPIVLASTSAITFYSDINGNGTAEQVRYFLSGNTIKKGVVVPTGSPLSYNQANEVVTTLISSVVASSTLPIFQYYPSTYAGTSSPLAQPVNIPSVRLVQITVIIDANPLRSPSKLVVTSQVMLRNLKDNQ